MNKLTRVILLGSTCVIGLSSCSLIRKPATTSPDQVSIIDAAKGILPVEGASYTRPQIAPLSGIDLEKSSGVLVKSSSIDQEISSQLTSLGLKMNKGEALVITKGGCTTARSALLDTGWRREIASASGQDESGTIIKNNISLQYAMRTSGNGCIVIVAEPAK